ncbi:hypothetical protein MMC17_005981 [Xylographa soralifera]|nr:hypothetical protein [Xylographa soralifera]
MATPQQIPSTMQASVESIDKADMAIRRNQETWIDLGEYESFVMEKHTARKTEEWLEKWTKYWKQIGVDGNDRVDYDEAALVPNSAALKISPLLSDRLNGQIKKS